MMKLLLIMWIGCFVMMVYHMTAISKSGIYPPKRVLRSRAAKWGIVSGVFFMIWFISILV